MPSNVGKGDVAQTQQKGQDSAQEKGVKVQREGSMGGGMNEEPRKTSATLDMNIEPSNSKPSWDGGDRKDTAGDTSDHGKPTHLDLLKKHGHG